ncbi:MAG: hypothetical protein N3B15_00875, partial [Planctomycetota bacterium]|nr:hypothetical protein [Planctomycetota bacterium]
PPAAPHPPLARVTATRRAGEALYLQIDAGQEAGLQVGQRLALVDGERVLARAVVELVDPGRATLRVLEDSWSAGAAREISVGTAVRR